MNNHREKERYRSALFSYAKHMIRPMIYIFHLSEFLSYFMNMFSEAPLKAPGRGYKPWADGQKVKSKEVDYEYSI